MGKRILLGMMALLLVFAITGCGGQEAVAGMRIQPAALAEEETNIVSLLHAGGQDSQIFDYNVGNKARSIVFTTYKLDKNGKWVTRFGPSSFALMGTTGRIAISFDNIDNGIKISMQDESGTTGSSTNPGQKSNTEGMGMFTSSADIVDIEYDKEIPLVMQVFSPGDDMSSGEVDAFYHPEKLLGNGYDAVFVVVIKFSKEGLQ